MNGPTAHPPGDPVTDVCVLGAGALGTAIGGTLAAGGLDVVLVSRRAEHVAAVERDGLLLHTPDGQRRVTVRARTSCAGLGPVATLLVLVKSTDTATAIAAASGAIGPDTLVLSLQNGLGNEQVLADAVGADRVAAGRTWVGGQLRGPGEVFAGVSGKRTVVGELDGTRSARLDRLAEQWTAAGVPVEVSESITSVIWDKLLTNVATGALSAITGLAYGGLYAVPELQEIGCAAAREAMAVATAAGVPLLRRDALEVWRQAGEGLGPDFRASMLLSLDAGAPTEVDVVNGAVVRIGADLGVPTPVNEVLVAAVRGRERAVGAATRRE